LTFVFGTSPAKRLVAVELPAPDEVTIELALMTSWRSLGCAWAQAIVAHKRESMVTAANDVEMELKRFIETPPLEVIQRWDP